ncbi:MAG: class I SAM-dependent methyltransferase [Chloroflexota bacterium]
MAVQVGNNNIFVNERARRFNAAMDRYPAARHLEILPFLCFFAKEEVQDWHVVDLASGGGYLGNFFENVAQKVTYVDQSSDMMKNINSDNMLVGDIRTASQVVGENQADMVTCLAAFHHLHVPDVGQINGVYHEQGTRGWTPERYLDIHLSQQLHDDVLADWYRMLKPGGWLVLIDVPGYPDAAWEHFWPDQQPHTLNTLGYQQQLMNRLTNWPMPTNIDILERYFSDSWQSLWQHDQQIQAMRHLLTTQTDLTMHDLVQSYQLPSSLFKQNAPMVPTDFFDDVIDRLGNQRHYGYFPRETKVRDTLERIGMENIHTGTFPTPWVFESKEAAVWFVHELFGFKSAWSPDDIPQEEFDKLVELLETYLGFEEDAFGRTLLFWQLSYFIGHKRSES